jgi:hypothetical protein
MKTDFDKYKTKLEKRTDSAISILSHTYPEQKSDAMQDYMKVLVMYKFSKDWRVQPIRNLLDALYVYPNRKQHNELLTQVHELKEELHEERISKTLAADPKKVGKQQLGGERKLTINYKLIGLLLLIAVLAKTWNLI